MCGIAGYSAGPSSRLERTLCAQALLAGIAERGADAVGYAHRAAVGGITIVKQRSGASALLQNVYVPPEATETLLHVRDYTKGHPRISSNNHPVRHGTVVGVHNGIIFNDDELLAAHGLQRDDADMSVDSEVIFALAEAFGNAPRVLEQLNGSMAAAWLDERESGVVRVARGVGRPLWIGRGDDEVVFASTRTALEIAGRYCRLRLALEELPEGTLVEVSRGHEVGRHTFEPDRSFEEEPLPAVRAPREGEACLHLLHALAAVA